MIAILTTKEVIDDVEILEVLKGTASRATQQHKQLRLDLEKLCLL